MVHVQLAVAIAAAVLPFSYAQASANNSSSPSVLETMAKMPTCAVPCLLDAVGKSGCDTLDSNCICSTPSIEKTATPCILKECTFMEALHAKNLTAEQCNLPIRDKTNQYNVMAIVLGVITNLLVTIRLIFKQFFSYRKSLGWDDYTIIAAMMIGIPATVINVEGLTAHGMGQDAWTMGPEKLTLFGTYFYIMEVLYLAEIAFIKLSLSLFYLYIFPGTKTRRFIWATIIFNIVSGLAFVIIGIVQCMPIQYFWQRYTDPTAQGHCLDINTFAWVHAAISIALDVWMIAIPLSQLRRLQLHWKKKVGVTLMFLLGTFVTIVSILRLQSLIYLARSNNPTWDQWAVAWWSTIEVHVGMICTCMPTLRLILVRLSPRVFSTGTSRNKSALARQGRPNSASYIMQTKEVNVSSIELSEQGGRNLDGGEGPVSYNPTRALAAPWPDPVQRPERRHDF